MNTYNREAINVIVNDFEQITKIVADDVTIPTEAEAIVAALLTVAVQIEDLRRESSKI